MPSVLAEYDAKWPAQFAAARARIVDAPDPLRRAHLLDLGAWCAGEPVIDITIEVPDSATESSMD